MTLLALTLAAMSLGEPMTVEVNRDRLTDRVSAVATLRSGDDRLDVGCTPDEARRIWVRLRSHRWFRAGNPFNGSRSFRYRFDDRPAERTHLRVRERSARMIGRGRVERFVRELVDARQLVIRAHGPERRRYDIVFEIDGAREAIGQALEACGDPFRGRLAP
jgi:hypothetical protein